MNATNVFPGTTPPGAATAPGLASRIRFAAGVAIAATGAGLMVADGLRALAGA